MRRTALRLASIATFSLILGSGLFAAPTFECPPDLGSIGGAYQDNRYTAEYHSWSWANDTHTQWYVCHCVRNLGRNPVKVTWPEVGLQGWVRLNSTLHFKTSASEDAFETRASQLQLGRNVLLDVETVFPKPRTRQGAVEQQPRIVPASIRVAQDKVADVHATETIARVAVPPLNYVRGMSPDEIDAFVEENPDLLQEVEMTFTSSVEDSLITYECSYSVANAGVDSALLLQIADLTVHEAVFESREARYVDWNEFPGHGGPIVMSGSLKLAGASSEGLETRMTTMNLLDSSGAILGAMPIQFLANKG